MEILLLFGIICLLVLKYLLPKGDIGERKVSRKIGSLITDNSDYHQFDNVILKTLDGTTEIDHLLISPFGIFVIEVKNYSGWIFGSANQKRWTQSFRRSHGLFGTGHKNTFQFQNPLHQNYKHVKAVQTFLNVDSKVIFNVVVFVGDGEFKTDIPENVMEAHDFLPYIKSHTERILNSEKVGELSQKLKEYTEHTSITQEDHLRNLEQNMANPICPRCGIKMVLRMSRKGPGAGSEFWGCSNYPSCKAIKNLTQ